MDSFMPLIEDVFAESGIDISGEKLERMSLYMARLLEKNEDVNLTRITEPEEFVRLNLLDSLSVRKLPEYRDAKSVIDVGTGAGLPGLPLAIMDPDKEFTLMDSVGKKLLIVEEISREAGIDNVNFVHERAEILGHDKEHRECYDLSVSRAVARLSALSELVLPFVKPGGAFIAYKGRKYREELGEAETALKILGSGKADIQDAGVEGQEHVLIVIKKARKTPGKYPRKPGEPTRNPLK